MTWCEIAFWLVIGSEHLREGSGLNTSYLVATGDQTYLSPYVRSLIMDRRRFIQSLSAAALSGSFPALSIALPATSPVITPTVQAPLASTFSLTEEEWITKIGIIAIGGAGSSILRDAKNRLPHLTRTVAIDDNPFTLHRSGADVSILIEECEKRTRGIQQAQNRYLKIADELTASVKDLHLVFVLSGLGGVIGTGLAPKVSETLAQLNIFNLALGVTPFDFEGLRRQQIALSGFNAIRRRAGTTFEISNQQFAASQEESATFATVLDLAPLRFEQIYRATLKPMTEFSFVGVDFEDVRTTLSHHGSGGFAMAIDHINSVEKATQKALTEISDQIGNLKQARGIVVVMESSRKSFRLRNVNEAMNVVKTHVSDETFVIFSAHYDESLSDTFRISLIANG